MTYNVRMKSNNNIDPQLTILLSHAKDAIAYARNHIDFSYTYNKFHELGDDTALAHMLDSIEEMRIERLDQDQSINYLYRVPDGIDSPVFNFTKINIKQVRKYAKSKGERHGNCAEYAYLVFNYLRKQHIEENMELFSIQNGDHCFVVLGRKNNSRVHDADDWGPRAILIDAWDNKYYLANNENIKNYFYRNLHGAQYFPKRQQFRSDHESRHYVSADLRSLRSMTETKFNLLLAALQKLPMSNDVKLAIEKINKDIASIAIEILKYSNSTSYIHPIERALSKMVRLHINKLRELVGNDSKKLNEVLVLLWLEEAIPHIHNDYSNNMSVVSQLLNYMDMQTSLMVLDHLINPWLGLQFIGRLMEQGNLFKIIIVHNNLPVVEKLIDLLDISIINNTITNDFLIDFLKETTPALLDKLLTKGFETEPHFMFNKISLSLIQFACLLNRIDLVTVLLKHRANPNNGDKLGVTPCMIAVTTNRVELLKTLLLAKPNLSLKATVSIKGILYKGYSALHFAVMFGRTDMVQLLLSHNANPFALTAHKEWPIDLATTPEIRNMLILAMREADKRNKAHSSTLFIPKRSTHGKDTPTTSTHYRYGKKTSS